MKISAQGLLENYDLNSLQQMARAQGIPLPKASSKGAVLPTIAATVFDAGRIARMLDHLSAEERTLLDRVILAGGEVSTQLIRNQLEGEGIVERSVSPGDYRYSSYHHETGSPRNRNSRKFEDLVARLGGLGLVFTREPAQGSGRVVNLSRPGLWLMIPDAILQHLPAATLPIETIAAPVSFRAADAGAMLRELYLLFSLANREKIALTNRGLVMKRSLVKIGQAFDREKEFAAVKSEEQIPGFTLLRALAEELELMSGSVGELLLDPRGEQFLALPSAERRQLLFEAYRVTSGWSELHRVPDLVARGKGFGVYAAPENVPPGRQRVLAELAEMPVGEWIAVEHLINRIRVRAYEFLFPRAPSADSYQYHSYRYYGFGYFNPYEATINGLGISLNIDRERSGWNIAEAAVIRVILTEALYALGIADLGGPDEEPTAFRITEDGGRVLRGESLEGVEEAAQVIVQPNFQIFAFTPTGEDVLFMLDRIAERQRTGQAMEYELTRDTLYRAQQSGLDTAEVIAFLEQVSTHPLPQNVRRTLEEWGAQHERITLTRRAPLIQTVDEASLDALYGDEVVRPLLGRRLTATVALVAGGQAGPLSTALLERGQIPTYSEGSVGQAGTQLRIEDDGKIVFQHPVRSIFTLHDLRSFTEQQDGQYALTPDSLRRAASDGVEAEMTLAILTRLMGGPPSEAIEVFIRRWAKDWGQAALYDATILQLDTPQQLADLLADPEISPLLQPIPDAPTLAIVTSGSRDLLRQRLAALGMTLR